MITNIYPNSKMSDMIVDYPSLITVLERLGIAFGFGDQHVKEIAERYGINLHAFLSILRVFEGSITSDMIMEKEAIKDLLFFLEVSHRHFKEKQIVDIKELISRFSENIPSQHAKIIISFFDGYMQEVSEHFLYEDDVVFPYIRSILQASDLKGYEIKEFEKNHTDIEQKLLDLKNILIKYIPENVVSDYRVMILRALIVLEQDLLYHTFIEDHLLVPSIKDMERELFEKGQGI